MNEAQRHYEDLLAARYVWMSSLSFEDTVAQQRALLTELGVVPRKSAIDLGCGPGYQALALSDLGFSAVTAIDTSRVLLETLQAASAGRAIRTLSADIRRFSKFFAPCSADTIVCMGDTLTHLENRDEVSHLLRDIRDTLAPNGRMVLTFRDFSEPLAGLDRFFPIKADSLCSMVCAIDDEKDHIVVNDLLHICTDGRWTFHKSSYRKLRLPPAAIAAELTGLGFAIEHDRPADRMHAIAARKLR